MPTSGIPSLFCMDKEQQNVGAVVQVNSQPPPVPSFAVSFRMVLNPLVRRITKPSKIEIYNEFLLPLGPDF